MVNEYQKTKYVTLTISGTNINDQQCIFHICKDQMFIETDDEMNQYDWSKLVTFNLLYGFDKMRETTNYSISYDKNPHTRVVLFNAFDLKRIQIPEEVEELELYGCQNLEEISLPDSLEKLTVIKCRNLSNISIPDNVHTLKLSKNRFNDNFNMPIHCMDLTIDINMMGDEVLHYIDNESVNINLVADNETLGL